jgi:hypothetical protein
LDPYLDQTIVAAETLAVVVAAVQGNWLCHHEIIPDKWLVPSQLG